MNDRPWFHPYTDLETLYAECRQFAESAANCSAEVYRGWLLMLGWAWTKDSPAMSNLVYWPIGGRCP